MENQTVFKPEGVMRREYREKELSNYRLTRFHTNYVWNLEVENIPTTTLFRDWSSGFQRHSYDSQNNLVIISERNARFKTKLGPRRVN